MIQTSDRQILATPARVISLADYRNNRLAFDDEPQPPSPRPLAARPAPVPIYVDAVALGESREARCRRTAVAARR